MSDEKKEETWVTSQSQERFQGEEYPSKEEAIIGGREEYDGESFYVGLRAELDLESLATGHGENVEEQISCAAWEEVGEVAEKWPKFTQEERDEIDAVVLKVLKNHVPRFFSVNSVIDIEAEGEEPK